MATRRDNEILYFQICTIDEVGRALEYHYKNFKKYLRLFKFFRGVKLQKWQFVCSAYANYEMDAYLNQIGRFYFFVNNPEVRKSIKKIPTPSKIKQLAFLRMKHSAHRAADYPRGDTKAERLRWLMFNGDQMAWPDDDGTLIRYIQVDEANISFRLIQKFDLNFCDKAGGWIHVKLNLHKDHVLVQEEIKSYLQEFNELKLVLEAYFKANPI